MIEMLEMLDNIQTFFRIRKHRKVQRMMKDMYMDPDTRSMAYLGFGAEVAEAVAFYEEHTTIKEIVITPAGDGYAVHIEYKFGTEEEEEDV